MAESIHINPDELNDQITTLKDLSSSTELIDKINSTINGFHISSGDAAETVREINLELLELSKKMQLLFKRTTDFLSNTNSHFVEADNKAARAIENASDTSSGGGK